jgi:hypothetical protein
MRYALLQRTRHRFPAIFLLSIFVYWNLNPTTVGFLLDPRESVLTDLSNPRS